MIFAIPNAIWIPDEDNFLKCIYFSNISGGWNILRRDAFKKN
ncbi:hypothetical protein VCHENC02_2540, partial [Vibrio harveyi]